MQENEAKSVVVDSGIALIDRENTIAAYECNKLSCKYKIFNHSLWGGKFMNETWV